MKDRHGNTVVARIKTGSIERRVHLASAGLLAGGRMASHMASNLLVGKEKKELRRRRMLSRQAAYLVAEMGKLKGSVVKIGQMMALYGEHFLPDEVTEALHAFEHQTTAIKWPVIRRTLRQQLGAERLAGLKIDRIPVGAASLGQVHRAVRVSDGRELCLKVQYPGVASAVDSDLNGVSQLLRLTRVIKPTDAFHEWVEELRTMLHKEIDYQLEAETTQRFAERLSDDSRFIVPEVFPEYCTSQVLAISYEPGYGITRENVRELPQERRNRISSSLLELFFKEMFSWHEIQTDPNFGNYRVRLGENGEPDRIVLLDFGAVNQYPLSVMKPVNKVIAGAWRGDRQSILEGSLDLGFISGNMPESIHEAFITLCGMMIEPVQGPVDSVPRHVLDERGRYLWQQSDLPGRIVGKAARSAVSRYFEVPPKEFIFLTRKLMGVYTFMSVLDARLNSRDIIAPYLVKLI